MRFLIYSFLFPIINCFINEVPSLLGTWVLRSTNDDKFIINYTYLTLEENNKIKLKTIYLNKIFAAQISRYGELKLLKKNNINLKNLFKPRILNLMKENNNVDLLINFNKLSKFSYSVFGIEIPEVKFKELNDYCSYKNINVKQYDKTIFIVDNESKLYYLFDLSYNTNRVPLTEVTLNTLLITQFISFLINLGLVNFIKMDEDLIHNIFK